MAEEEKKMPEQPVPPFCAQMLEKVEKLDKRLGKMEVNIRNNGRIVDTYGADLKDMDKELKEVREKVFNGFETKLDHLDGKVEKYQHDNEKAHAEIKDALRGMMKFWGTSMILILVALISILGSIWLRDRSPRDATPEVEIHAPVDPTPATE